MATDQDRMQSLQDSLDDPLVRVELVYQLWWRWADFELTVIDPHLPIYQPPILLMPEHLPEGNQPEFVYPITDHGYKFCTSKGEEMLSSGLSLYKMHCTIEKIIAILIDRIEKTDIDPATEVIITLGGHELLQRKCFEVVINLTKYNLVVKNFDPQEWGDEYLKRIKRMAERGYGYPPESPRDVYRRNVTSTLKR